MQVQFELLQNVERDGRGLLRSAFVVIGAAVLAIAAQAWVNHFLPRPYFFFFFPAAVFVAWARGFKESLATIVLCALSANFFFVDPSFVFGFSNGDSVALTFATVASVFTGWAVSLLNKKNRHALLARQELATILQSIGDGVLVVGRNKEVLFLNPVASSLTGWSLDDARGLPMDQVFNVIDRETRTRPENLVDQVLREGKLNDISNRTLLLSKDGSERVIEDVAAPIGTTRDNSGGVVLVFRDVTQQYLTRAELARHAERLERLANAIPQIVYISDANGMTRFLNDRWYEYTGLERSTPAAPNSQIHPEDLPALQKAWGVALLEKQPFEAELRIKGADGNYRWFVTRSAPNIDNGRLIGWFGVSTDIQEQAEKRSDVEFLNHVSQAYSQGSPNICDIADSIVSLTIEKFSGWAHLHLLEPGGHIRLVGVKHTRAEYTSLSWEYDENFPAHIDDPGGLGEVIKSGKTQYMREMPQDLFESMPPKQREIFEKLKLRSSLSVALRTTQKAFGVLTLVSNDRLYTEHDVMLAEQLAERSAYAIQNAQLLDELTTAKNEAERANELKSAFLANMSHEIRTPLGAMLGFADLMRDPGITPEERSNYIDILTRNGESLSVIINDILDLSKVEAGHLTLENTAIDPATVVTDVCSLLEVKAKEKGLMVETEFDPSTPRSIVADPTRVKQILLNLVGNAIKFTHSGGVKIRSYSSTSPRGKAAICYEVSDTGIGIPAAQRNRIFEMFVQADGSMTRRFGGTGLGLALSRKLAREMGGDTVVEKSEEGRGTTFTVTIEDRPELRNANADDIDHAKVFELPDKALQDVRILVVDDAADNQHLIGRYLSKQGAITESAENGFVGYRSALSGNHDLVLMDIQMPVMDGYTATQKLRDAGYSKPIIALTAHAMSEIRRKALNVGYSDYLTKPINSKELIVTILKHLNAK